MTAIDLIKSFEGLSLDAYFDPGTGNLPITIGYGSTRDFNGLPFSIGDKITQAQADDLLAREVEKVALKIENLKGLGLTQNQFDSLVSFAYNVGWQSLAKSTLLKKIRLNPADPAIREQFLRWNRSGKKVMAGLVRRRLAESELYFSTT